MKKSGSRKAESSPDGNSAIRTTETQSPAITDTERAPTKTSVAMPSSDKRVRVGGIESMVYQILLPPDFNVARIVDAIRPLHK